MALTNAERQARHRERTKEKLRNATGDSPLRNEFQPLTGGIAEDYSQASDLWLRHLGVFGKKSQDELATAAEFLAEEITMAEIKMMVRMCAFTRLNQLYRLHQSGSDEEPPLPDWWIFTGQLEQSLRNEDERKAVT